MGSSPPPHSVTPRIHHDVSMGPPKIWVPPPSPPPQSANPNNDPKLGMDPPTFGFRFLHPNPSTQQLPTICPWIHPKFGFLAPTPPPQPTEPHSTQSGPSIGGTSRVSGGLRGLHLGGSPPSPRPPSPCSSAPQGPAVRGGPGLRQGEMHAGLREEHHPQHVLRRRPPGRRRFVPGEKSPFCHLLLSPPPTWGGAELGVPGWGWRLGAHWGSLGFLPPLSASQT